MHDSDAISILNSAVDRPCFLHVGSGICSGDSDMFEMLLVKYKYKSKYKNTNIHLFLL